VREQMTTDRGFSAELWHRLASDVGICGLAIPARYGGADATYSEVGLVLEELGRFVTCVPYFSTVVLAQTALLTAGDDAAADRWLPDLCVGASTASLAFAETGRPWDESGVTLPAQRTAGGTWRLSGEKNYVLDGHTAGTLLVAARTAAGVSLFAVAGDAAGVDRTPLPTMDQTRK